MSRTFILYMTRVWIVLFVALFAAAIRCGAGTNAASGADVPVRGGKAANDWPQWRGPDRNGISSDTGLLKDWEAKTPKLLWTGTGVGEGFASVAVVDGRIYTTGTMAGGQAVTCVSAADGKTIWQTKISSEVPRDGGYPGCRCTPSIDGDRVYAISSDGKIACLKLAGGGLVWSRDFKADWGGRAPNWGFSESPLVDGDRVLCTPGGPEAMVVALNKMTGKDIWRAKTQIAGEKGRGEGAGYSSIVISNACGIKQYVQLVSRGVIGVRASDGEFLWGYNGVANQTANIPTPLISGDYVFTSTGYGTGSALLKLVKKGRGVDCEEQYFLNGNTAQNHHGQMILKDGHVYMGHGHKNGYPMCIEMESGKIVWSSKQRGPGSASAAITLADDHLVFRYESGEVALIEATPQEYRLKGSFQPDYVSGKPAWSHPVIIGGKMYLRDQDKLMCYDVRG